MIARYSLFVLTALTLSVLLACGETVEPTPIASIEETAKTLETPYEADAIRAAFVEGLEIVTRTRMPEGETLSRMLVTESGPEGMVYADGFVAADGTPTAEPTTGESTWVELRDHALFPADSSSRERQTRETALGQLDGWLYSTRSPQGVESEFFFADAYPGPPVLFRSIRDQEVLFEAEQVVRQHPE